MSILGEAIGAHLQGAAGRVQVELPARMAAAAAAVAATVNAYTPGKAVLIVPEGQAGGEFTSSPGEALAWRTDHDRIFVWTRGDFDPDSSFTSAVEPFLTRDFPEGCRCGLELLADLGAAGLLSRSPMATDPGTRQNFVESARSALAFAAGALADLPDTPNEPPMLALVRHWDAALDDVAAVLAASGRPLRPADALELFRAMGLPAPESAFAGDTLRGERIFEGLDAAAEAGGAWAEFCAEAFGDRASREQFHARLHGYAQDNGLAAAPWSALDWSADSPSGTPFDTMRQLLARAEGPLSIEHVPERPGSDAAWWGLSIERAKAVARMGGEWTWRPVAGGQACPVLEGSAVLFKTEFAEVEGGPAGWSLVLDALELEVAPPSGRALVGSEEPPGATSGDFWIQPQVAVRAQRLKTSNAVLRMAGERAVVSFALRATVPASTGEPHAWNPVTQVTAAIQVRERHGDLWLAPRPVRLAARAILPSPFSPTAMFANDRTNRFLSAFPMGEAGFEFEEAVGWQAVDMRDVPLPPRGQVACVLYRAVLDAPGGRLFEAGGDVALKALKLPSGTFGPVEGTLGLQEGDALCWRGAEMMAFRSADTEPQSPSGLIRAISREDNNAAVDAPTAALEEIRGVYELELAAHIRSVCNGRARAGLGQLLAARGGVVSGSPQGAPAFDAEPVLQWTGRGDVSPVPAGAARAVAALEGFPEFQAAAEAAMAGYLAGSGDLPLVSSWSYGGLTAAVVERLCRAHAALVAQAADLPPSARMLARFPFSIILAERRPHRPDLRIAAILLSPLHPARLAWAWAVAHAAASTTEDQLPSRLLGLAEGWNIPCSSAVPNAVDAEDLAVAQPVDYGAEATFAAWAGLVATVDGQCAPPSLACGLAVPWAGQTGVTEGALASALADYKLVHPFGETLSIALDALQAVPRSLAIDDAVLRLLGGEHNSRYSFPGGVEVWDSKSRLGDPPSRQHLLARRRTPAAYPSFTWRTVDDSRLPPRVDVRIFEAIETTTSHTAAKGLGAWAALPLRRFAGTRYDRDSRWLDRDAALAADLDDPLGLAALTRALEFSPSGEATAIRTRMPDALGRENNASRWTVLGDLHLHPTVLSEYADQDMGQLLWEWRTGWLGVGRDRSPGERPYYVTSEVPPSFKHGLAARQGLTPGQIAEVLADLGRRGVGLASLFNGGAPRERGAMGFFYAFRLLFPPTRGVSLGAAWLHEGESHALLPLDAVHNILEAMAGPDQPALPGPNRADFVLLVLKEAGGHLDVTAVPIEVKHRGTPAKPAGLSPRDKAHAQQQVLATRQLLANVVAAFSNAEAPPAALIARRNALALLMELGLGLSPRPEKPEVAARLIRAALWGSLNFKVANGAIFTFNPGGHGTLLPISPYQVSSAESVVELLMDPCALPGMFWQGAAPEAVEGSARADLDRGFRRMVDSATPTVAVPAAHGLGASAAPRPAPRAEGPDPRRADGAPGTAATLPDDVGQAPPAQAALEPAAPEPHLAQLPSAAPPPAPAPGGFIGAASVGRRWGVIGRNERGQAVGFDLEQVHATGVFGYMGSGKSYFLNTLIESAVAPMAGLNELPQPLAVVVFNYRQSASDRFEYTSLCHPNDNPDDVVKLAAYGAQPQGLPDVQILALPGQLNEKRLAEYGPAKASELLFDPTKLSLEDWMLLMGEPGHQRVYLQTITSVLRDLEREGRPVSLQALADALGADEVATASRRSGELRLRFLQPYVSDAAPTDFAKLVRPGATTVIDLRASLFDKHDALRFFLVCANQIGQLRGFNKLVVFDEAHEYMSSEFEDKISSRIRNLRHEGASYVFATQDVASLPPGILKFLDTAFVFGMGTARNQMDLGAAFAPMRELGDRVLKVDRGQCYAWSQTSVSDQFAVPRRVFIRPRATRHGGGTQTFLGPGAG